MYSPCEWYVELTQHAGQGYKTDVKMLRGQLKDLEKQLYKVTVHASSRQDDADQVPMAFYTYPTANHATPRCSRTCAGQPGARACCWANSAISSTVCTTWRTPRAT